MKVGIVILSLTTSNDLYTMTQHCINTLHLSEENIEFDVYVIESNMNYTFPVYSKCTMIFPKEEFNYNKFCKIGISYCDTKWIVLCNNDLVFHKGWFSSILKGEEDLGYISYSPWNPFDNWHQHRFPIENDYYVGYGIGYHLCGWCIIAHRSLFEVIDLSDDVSFWCSDNIYADELQKHNIPHALVRNSKVDHIVSKTLFTLPYEKIKELTEYQGVVYANRNRNNNS